jgi:hypothetical protein
VDDYRCRVEGAVLQTSGDNAVTSVNVKPDAHLGTYWT